MYDPDDRDPVVRVPRRPPRKKGSSLGLILGLVGGGVFLVLLCCGGVVFFFVNRAQALNVFTPHLAEYTATPANDPRPDERPDPDGGYIRGKAVAVDLNGPKVDGLTNDLPEDIRASRPEEVQTVIWLKYISVSGYKQGNRAVTKTDIQVTVIDRQAQKTVAFKHFESEGSTVPPHNQVMQFLRSLPRKQ
jgi:hypothetical protein